MPKYIPSLLLFVFILSFFACTEDIIYTPKPRAYPKIEFPKQGGVANFDLEMCDLKFQRPDYTKVEKDSLFFNEGAKHPCWFDITYPMFSGRVHCTYVDISKENPFNKLINDAHTLANQHNIKADYIDTYIINNPKAKVYGTVFNIEGPVASPYQFYLTDSTNHFFRGSLYFKTQSNADSLAPVLEFVKKDIIQMINTFEWEN